MVDQMKFFARCFYECFSIDFHNSLEAFITLNLFISIDPCQDFKRFQYVQLVELMNF